MKLGTPRPIDCPHCGVSPGAEHIPPCPDYETDLARNQDERAEKLFGIPEKSISTQAIDLREQSKLWMAPGTFDAINKELARARKSFPNNDKLFQRFLDQVSRVQDYFRHNIDGDLFVSQNRSNEFAYSLLVLTALAIRIAEETGDNAARVSSADLDKLEAMIKGN